MHERCRGTAEDGRPCQCLEFSRPEPGKRLICEECGHGRSNHPSSGNTLTLEAPVTATATVTAKRRILDAFGARANAGTPSPSTVQRDSNTSIEEARRETLSGFRDRSGKKVRVDVN